MGFGAKTDGAHLGGRAKFDVEVEKIEGPPAASFSIGDVRDENGVPCIYDRGFDPAYEWVEVTDDRDATVPRRRFIRGAKLQEDGSPGLLTR